jgi:Protein of unknown function (DUF3604)
MTKRSPVRRRFPPCTLLTALWLPALLSAPANAVPGPWARTEARQPCAGFDLFRQPYFGDTHVHTSYSSDAVFAGTREDPRGAYRFALGQSIGLPPYDAQGVPTRTAQLRRPLDFTAVTDHAEQFGEISICLTPDLPGYDSVDCVAARAQLATPPPPLPSQLPPATVIAFLLGYGALSPPQRFPWCGPGGVDCLAQASLIWQDTQSAAEEFYDRTTACTFTTFVGYEWSGQPGGNNLHRNVIFRNSVVPAMPTSFMEEPTPDGLRAQLRAQCLQGLPGCDVLAIPHNPNASGGLMFVPVNSDNTPLTAAGAAARAAMEPLVEMNQHKGDSECRPGVTSTDELCGFEKLNRVQLFNPVSNPNQVFPVRNYVRNVLKEGLVQEQALGVNPFKLGMIGSTDTHNATPGGTEEQDFGANGHIGLRDHATPAFMLQRVTPAGIEGSPGGLAVVWAEENSRDALFAAMRRKEVYGTSGSRPILRFFAGREPGLQCGDPAFVEAAYDGGVPMGGEIGPVSGDRSPRFGLLAFRDPGTPTLTGTPLQLAQIVKGWVDAAGQSHEKVFDVAGNPNNGASVDTTTCTATGPGADSLCAVWTDPEFDASQRAFYYARVIENPTCRWSTYHCNALGVDCSQPASVPPEYAECCSPLVAKTIQERAWSSPIWYRPEGIARLRGSIRFAAQPGRDRLVLSWNLGTMPVGFNFATDELTISVRDDDTIYQATVPAGTLQEVRPAWYAWNDPDGTIGGIRTLSFKQRSPDRVAVRLRTVPMSLSNADPIDHFVEVSLRGGTAELTSTPLWRQSGKTLAANH